MANDCNKIMCDLDLTSKQDTNKWLLKNHQDKGGKIDPGLFTSVTNCFKNRNFCHNNVSTKKLAIKYKHSNHKHSNHKHSNNKNLIQVCLQC